MSQKQSTLRKLARDYPSSNMQTLVQLRPFEDLGHYSFAYEECAERLFSSFKAEPLDDTLLLPFLALYRHAYELRLKNVAMSLAAHHRRLGASDAAYSSSAMRNLMGPGGFGHSLEKSFAWVTTEIERIGLGTEPMPPELEKAIVLLQNLDPSGTTFRYPDDNLRDVLNVDFIKLHDDLKSGINWLSAVHDWASETLAAVPDMDDYI